MLKCSYISSIQRHEIRFSLSKVWQIFRVDGRYVDNGVSNMEQHDLNKVFLSVSGMTIKSKSENVPKRLENAMSRWCESGEVSCESQNEVDLYIQGKGLTLRNDTVGVHGTVISSNLTNPINDFTSGMHMVRLNK